MLQKQRKKTTAKILGSSFHEFDQFLSWKVKSKLSEHRTKLPSICFYPCLQQDAIHAAHKGIKESKCVQENRRKM
jgi:hypothetical protein